MLMTIRWCFESHLTIFSAAAKNSTPRKNYSNAPTLLAAISLILLSKTALNYVTGDDQNGVIGIVSLLIILFVFLISGRWFFRGISMMRQRHDAQEVSYGPL